MQYEPSASRDLGTDWAVTWIFWMPLDDARPRSGVSELNLGHLDCEPVSGASGRPAAGRAHVQSVAAVQHQVGEYEAPLGGRFLALDVAGQESMTLAATRSRECAPTSVAGRALSEG